MTDRPFLLISSNSSGRGGGERYLVFLCTALRTVGFDVQVLLSSASYMDDWALQLDNAGAVVIRRDLIALAQRPLRFVQAMTDRRQQLIVARVCAEIRPCAILVNQQYDEDGLDYIEGARMAAVAPVGGVIHMPMTAGKEQRPLGRLRGWALRRWYARHPYAKVFSSAGGREEFCAYYPRSYAESHVVHSSYPFSEQAPDASLVPPELFDDRPNIGFVGQFVPQKNIDLLIDAWLLLRESGSTSRLILIGDGPQREPLMQRLRQAAPESEWRVTGWGDHYRAYLATLSVYAMSSHFEGLPLALLEAVGEGIPTVVTNFNGAEDVAALAPWVQVDRTRTPASFGAALERALGTPRVSTGDDRVRRFREHFSQARMAEGYARVLVPGSPPGHS